MAKQKLEVAQVIDLVNDYRVTYIKIYGKEPTYLILGYHWYKIFCDYLIKMMHNKLHDSHQLTGIYCYQGMIVFKREMDKTFIDVAGGVKNEEEARGF